MAKQIKVTLVKSTIGRLPSHKLTAQALGLKKIGSDKIHNDNKAIRGMVRKIGYLLKVEEINN